MSRILAYVGNFRLLMWFGAALALGSAAGAQDDVYRYRDREGREVYTNLEGAAAHGGSMTKLDLPPLSSVDFQGAAPEELRRLDAHVSEAHHALQSGQHCEAIRKLSRVPLRSRIWSDHGRKAYVAAGLLGFAALLSMVRRGRRLSSIVPLVPFLGFGFLFYAAARETQANLQAVAAGLRACSEQLPDANPDDRGTVKSRLSRALDVRRNVNAAYESQAREIESIMGQRW